MDADDRAYDPVGSEPVYYENNLAVQGDTLLEILDKKCRKLKVPMYIHRFGKDALSGISEITVSALDCSRVESWKPLLKARRAILQIWSPDEEKKIRLPLSHTGGFDAALTAAGGGSQERGLSGEKTISADIDYEAYDSRFPAIQDRDLKLDMAVSRLLYPVQLSLKARSRYEQHVKNRFRPAMLLLVSGQWNQYGKIPEKAPELLNLKKVDRFLKKELLEKAISCGQTEFVQLLTGTGARRISERTQQADMQALWQLAGQELYRRKSSMEAFCGLLSFKEVLKDRGSEKPGTDGSCVYYTRCALQQLAEDGLETLARFYTHMLVHCIYLHPFSDQAGNKDYELACDLAAEYAVDQIFGPGGKWMAEKQMVYDCLLREDPVLTADRIYEKIVAADKTTRDSFYRWFTRDFHGFWLGNRDSGENSGKFAVSSEVLSEAADKKSTLSRKWSSAGEGFLQAGEKKAGKRSHAAGHEQETAELEKRPGHDYHDFLRQFMVLREDRILDTDSYDPVYYTYGLNTYGNIPLVEPLETKEVMRLEELVIVIDTSGSCSGRLVRFFLEETWSVFGQSENFFDQFHVRILQCDAVVQEDVKLTSLQEAERYMKNLVIKGGGGTDFREAFSYIRQLQRRGELRRLKGILYFTDGFGTFPVQAPGCRTAFIFLKSRFGQVEVPCWADKLLLELPEGADWEPEYTGGFQVNILR